MRIETLLKTNVPTGAAAAVTIILFLAAAAGALLATFLAPRASKALTLLPESKFIPLQ
jgi:sorbitol-specific phosphotransferase system component IIBC